MRGEGGGGGVTHRVEVGGGLIILPNTRVPKAVAYF